MATTLLFRRIRCVGVKGTKVITLLLGEKEVYFD
jgi:hypothetical protein